jgi:hypothetical protein
MVRARDGRRARSAAAKTGGSSSPPKANLSSPSIHDRFYGVELKRSEIDLERVRVIDLTVDKGWRLTARTNGFANSHYQSGWFRVSSGVKIRLYRAGSDRLVLLPPKDDGAPSYWKSRSRVGL